MYDCLCLEMMAVCRRRSGQEASLSNSQPKGDEFKPWPDYRVVSLNKRFHLICFSQLGCVNEYQILRGGLFDFLGGGGGLKKLNCSTLKQEKKMHYKLYVMHCFLTGKIIWFVYQWGKILALTNPSNHPFPPKTVK